MPYLYPTPLTGYRMVAPERPPHPGQVLLGYEVLNAEDGVFTKPKPKRMNTRGWLAFGALLVCFWPAACVPCFTSCSYTPCQRPVYGWTTEV